MSQSWNARPGHRKAAHENRLTETGGAPGDCAGIRLKIEFAYLKQLPREYTGTRHIVTVGRRPDGREEREERPGEPPPNHEAARDQNVKRIYIVHAAEPNTEIREGNLENGQAIG